MGATVQDISGVIQDARMEKIPDIIGLKTVAARESFFTGLRDWSSNPAKLLKKTAMVEQLRGQLGANSKSDVRHQFDAAFSAIAKHEPVVRGLLSPPTAMEDEGYSQLLFRGEHTQSLNHIPHLLAIWSVCKIFVFPGLSVCIPIFTLIAPYILLKYVWKMPCTFDEYIRITKAMFMGGGMGALLGQLGGGGMAMPRIPEGLSEQAKSFIQVAFLFITVGQSIWQPIQGARHTWRLQAMIIERADAVRDFLAAYTGLQKAFKGLGIRTARIPIPVDIWSDRRRLVAFCLEKATYLKVLLGIVGRWEVAYRLATAEGVCSVQWISNADNAPVIDLHGICDVGIAPALQRQFSCRFGIGESGGHALLTGPNRGGKSTALRAVLRNLLLAHTYGVCFASSATLTAFDWVQSCLRLEDLPGRASLFEREVAFAAASLARPAGTRGFVCVDELFHSTNPPDGKAAAELYLGRLWNAPGIASMISTHVFELVEDAPAGIQRLCCPATALADGAVEYHYGLQTGVCKVSSVGDILRENGMD
jgi:hypothetical protein